MIELTSSSLLLISGYYHDSTYHHVCTGSIITPYIIITAAHCTYKTKRKWFVRAGTLNLKYPNTYERRVRRTIEHPMYQGPRVYFDLSLLVLDQVSIWCESIFHLIEHFRHFHSMRIFNQYVYQIKALHHQIS